MNPLPGLQHKANEEMSEVQEPVERLEWDSEFFGFPTARLSTSRINEQIMSQVLEEAQKEGIRCLYYEADSNDPVSIALAEANGFKLVDVRITLEIASSSALHPRPARDITVRGFREEEIETLARIARKTSRVSRYHFDTNFPPGASERLYDIWLRNSCSGYADKVLVAELQSEPVGFITCKVSQGEGRIVLVGVDDRFRGRGVGASLVDKALNWFGSQGIKRVWVVTQGRNIEGQRLYHAIGFNTASVTLFYHKWFNDS